MSSSLNTHNHSDTKLLYHHHYYSAHENCCITTITTALTKIRTVKKRFARPDVKLYSKIQSLLLNAPNGLLYEGEYNIVWEIYKEDFNNFSLQVQLRLLPEFIQVSNFFSISDLINAFIVSRGILFSGVE